MRSALLKAMLFIVLLLLMIEISYRLYVLGPQALNPFRFNSFTVLLRSGLVELADQPEVYYQLKPNLDSWLQGKKFRTNSFGLADKEYTLQKPDNTFRVVVLGSSWTMASGVLQQQTYHSLMEQQLNERYPGKKFEFINFAVEMYGLREIVATLKYRALDWDPDLILVAITPYTAALEWKEASPDQVLPARINPFFQSYVLRVLNSKFNLQLVDNSVPGRDLLPKGRMNFYMEQTLRAFRELDAMADERNMPLATMWLTFGNPGDFEPRMEQLADELDIVYIPAYKALRGTTRMIKRRQVSAVDSHPNARAHEIIADTVLNNLIENKLIPGVK